MARPAKMMPVAYFAEREGADGRFYRLLPLLSKTEHLKNFKGSQSGACRFLPGTEETLLGKMGLQAERACPTEVEAKIRMV
jgi:hypothetical protein